MHWEHFLLNAGLWPDPLHLSAKQNSSLISPHSDCYIQTNRKGHTGQITTDGTEEWNSDALHFHRRHSSSSSSRIQLLLSAQQRPVRTAEQRTLRLEWNGGMGMELKVTRLHEYRKLLARCTVHVQYKYSQNGFNWCMQSKGNYRFPTPSVEGYA